MQSVICMCTHTYIHVHIHTKHVVKYVRIMYVPYILRYTHNIHIHIHTYVPTYTHVYFVGSSSVQ